jgi:hypothetical protein
MDGAKADRPGNRRLNWNAPALRAYVGIARPDHWINHRFAVDPTRRLEACAAHEGLEILRWNNVAGVKPAPDTFRRLPDGALIHRSGA